MRSCKLERTHYTYFKVLLLFFTALRGLAPAYFSDMLAMMIYVFILFYLLYLLAFI